MIRKLPISAIDTAGSSCTQRLGKALAILAPGNVHEIASLLESLAETSGNRLFENAAQILLGHRRAGRRPLNDGAALVEMQRALDQGDVETVAAAARYAAAKLPGRHSLDSAAKRLERKLRKKLGRNIKSHDAHRRLI